MTSQKFLFLAGVFGALAVGQGVAQAITGQAFFGVLSAVALVPGILLLFVSYFYLFREWRAARAARRAKPSAAEVWLMVVTPDDSDEPDDADLSTVVDAEPIKETSDE